MNKKVISIITIVVSLAMLLAYTTPFSTLKKAKVGRPERKSGEGLFLAHQAKKQMGHKQAVAFCNKIEEMSCAINVPAEWPMSIIYHESRFKPAAKSPKSTASGLLQMLEVVAKRMGTTTEKLRGMNPVAQVPYIQKYFEMDVAQNGGYISVTDMYLAVFAPARRKALKEIYQAGGDLSTLMIYKAGTPEYAANAPIDPTPGDAGLTYADLSRHIMDMFPEIFEYKSIPCQEG